MKIFVSIILILCTAGLATLSLQQLGRVDFLDSFSTEPAKEDFAPLFDHNLLATSSVVIKTADQAKMKFSFDPENRLWFGTEPWQDRADGPKAIESLILFAHNAEIQDHIEVNAETIKELGFDEKAIHARFTNSLGDTIADFSIGKSSAWKKKIKGEKEILLPTVYLRLKGPDADDHIYLCTDTTGDIHSLFEDKFRAFRDHRPFALNKSTLQQVRLLRGKTEIVLSHPRPDAPWVLTKPLELATDGNAVMKFLANLSKLEAIALHPTGSITLPDTPEDTLEVAVTSFGADEEITLKVYPPSEGAGSSYATISNRDVVFELPLIATQKTSNYITQLPNSVNELRSRQMMQWSKHTRSDLRSIIVRSPQTPAEPVIVARIPGSPYKLITPSNKKEAIDESVFAELMQKIALTPIKDFASDAAVDLSPFGLDKPSIIVDFLFFESKHMQLLFGKVTRKAEDGTNTESYYASLRGTQIVWEVTPEIVSSIPTRYWSWQPKDIWNLPVIDIKQFTAQQTGKEKLTVDYNYLEDSLVAKLGDKDMSDQLLPERAKFFLNANHLLIAQKRLSPNNTAAIEALKTPAFTASISVQEFDNEGMPSQLSTYTLTLGKSSKSGRSAFYYAKASNIDGYFILSLYTVGKLAALDLFEEE
ncbi:DUF4340 domain-containing protein [Rubritalea profundi]|uniref:DUF4340 domain-containing protein n=1 Tax=Rubritalea profundi TaxID=1658618 RepID=A0A2S7U2F6_9BACT|nr:DUF4340 domain-containing protein [Rubritalea profundi]PQJ29169.1 hypothetical protein BSZ32_12165 [Rubritalea profundi]